MNDILESIKSEKPTISFELFPPKQEVNLEKYKAKAEQIASLKPAFISVTYGAGGGTSRFTLDIADDIQKKYDVPALAHLTCVSTSKEKIDEYLKHMKERGLKNIMALRGDIPEENSDRSKWAFQHASDLASYIRSNTDFFVIGGACYPEKHPESSNTTEDIKHLYDKQASGINFLTTQMFFDNNLLFNFLYKARENGVTIPVIPGIMPVTKAKQIERILKLSQAFLPRRFVSIVDRFGDDENSMREAGIAYATDQIIDLFANGINHVHIYVMNDYEVASSIINNVKNILGR